MKAFNILKLLSLAVFSIGLCFPVFAQEENNTESDKKVIIIKKTIDEDGNEVIEKTVHEGDDVNVFHFDEEGENTFINVEVDAEDHDGEKIIKIRRQNGDGEVEVFEWKGEGEIPEDIKIKMEEYEGEGNSFIKIDVDVEEDDLDGKKVYMIKKKMGDGEENVFEWEGEGEMPEDIKIKMEEFKGQLHEEGAHKMIWVSKDKKGDSPNGNQACLGVMIKETIENINGVETTEGLTDDGVVVLDVMENTAAQEAGLQSGDVITSIGGTSVKNIEEVLDALNSYSPNDEVAIAYLRDNQAQSVTATLKACANLHAVEKEIIKKIIIKDSEEGSDEVPNQFEIDIPENTLELSEFRAFPNPTNGQLTVNFTGEATATTVRISDVSGKKIYLEELNNFDGNYTKEISLSDSVPGTLLLSITQGEKVFTEAIILNKGK